ncbi:MAG: 2-dehydro-3-deoxygalactonokinase [Betaproteobacteria bacterium]
MIAIDWGTTSFRAYRLDASGAVTEKREAPLGVLAVKEARFAEALESQVSDWLEPGAPPIIMSGMIGSRQGWREQAYVRCPAGPEELCAHLGSVTWGMHGRRAWIVPGLITRDAQGVHDVLRGEETQLIGVLDDLGPGSHTVCLPGTHSKWVRIVDRKIVSFTTHMTGEMFAVLRDHSILGRTMENAGDIPAAFDAGVARARETGGLLHHLFGIRADSLAGTLSAEAAHEFLSGLLIGHEIAAVAPARGTVHLLGAPVLTARYERALSAAGCAAQSMDPDAAVRGLFRLAAGIEES